MEKSALCGKSIRFFLLNLQNDYKMKRGVFHKIVRGVKMKALKLIREYLIITIGVFIASAAVFFFLVPSHLSIGSVSGLGMILQTFIPLPLSVITFVLNVILLLLGFFLIGRDFGIKTVYTSLFVPVFIGVFEKIYPDFQSVMGDPFLDMICYLFVLAIGQTILFNCNASSGGLDIVGKIINKYFRVELGSAIAMAGMCVALASFFTSDAKTVALSILGTYLSGIVLDHFIFGFNLKRRVCILSKKEQEITDFILHQLHSGATIYEATGAYDNKMRREVITIVNKTEYSRLMNYISKTDPDAFVTVYAVNEVIYKPKV